MYFFNSLMQEFPVIEKSFSAPQMHDLCVAFKTVLQFQIET